jgi:DNA polymerase-3 subunit gamma/tau
LAYEALARKYRPRTFDEVVGQEPIVKTLGNALREKRIHHAYVFSGVRGVGKTTVARIFAKALNCERGPTPTPCLKCDPCLEIAAGRDLDVIEMDAASRTGVDDVRDLIDTTRYAPARDRYKVFIIDEFHMLSKPAFNALLKTLEEPPARVVFLMATTELHKVLPTVLSRTQQFDFRKVGVREIADQLAMIAKAEKVKAPRAALEMLARAGDGSVRDAESLLDQAIAFCGSELGENEVRALLGLVPEETVEAFLAAVAEKDAGALVRMIAAALTEGHDLRIFHAGLVEGVRRLLVLKSVSSPSEILGLSDEDEKRLAALAARFSTDSLLRAFSILAALEAPLKYSDQPRYLLEAAAIRLASISELAPIEELIARLDAGEPPRTGPPARPAAASPPARPSSSSSHAPPVPATRPGGPAKRTRSEADDRGDRAPGAGDAPAGSSDADAPLEADPMRTTDRDEPEDLAAGPGLEGAGSLDTISGPGPSLGGADAPEVRAFLARVRERKEALAMLVEHAAAVLLEESTLVVLYDDSQTFLRKSAEQPANTAILNEIAAAILGPGGSAAIRRGQAPSPAGRAPRSAASPPPGAATAGASVAGDTAALSGGGAGENGASREDDDPGFADEPEAEATLPLDVPAAPAPATAPGSSLSPSERDASASPPRASSAAPAGAPAPGVPAGTSSPTGARYQRLHAQALEDPVVKSLVGRFGGRIVEIKEVP